VSEDATVTELVTLTIDDQEVSVPAGTLIIRAAESVGTIVPRFCDHPLLDPVGACRQCVVEVEGQPKPVMSCTMPVAPGMVVRTHLTSEVARTAQRGTIEFLLVNHPLDCPMCDKGGECPLQDQALEHGANTSRFIDQKRRYDKPVAVSPQVLLDRERCVLCARCTRFSEQISGDPFIELFERGALEQVAIYEDEPYESYFSGNVIQICPVGALTSTSYRFKARPFDVVTTPSVCDHCSAGCTLTVQSRRGEVQRQLARTNMDVNEEWSCDKGRFGFTHLTAPGRLTRPALRRDGALVDATWGETLGAAARAITAALAAGPGRVAVVTGSRIADEDALVVSRYVRTVLASDDLDFRTTPAPSGEVDDLTALVPREQATYADVEAAPVIVVAGLDPEEEVPILHLRLRKAWRRRTARIVVVGPHLGTLAPIAWRHVPTAPGAEAATLAALASGEGEVARALVDADRPVVLVGERAGAGSVRAGAALAGATGGRFGWVPRRAGARGALEAGLVAGALPGGRRLEDPADRAELEALWGPLPTAPGRDLAGILAAAADGGIDVLHLIGIDLVRDVASPDLVRRALERVGTVIVQDLAATATVTAHADIVLPATATQERAGTRTDWEGRAQRFARAVDGPELVLDDREIVGQLAILLGRPLPTDLEALRAERARLGLRATPHDFSAVAPDAPAAVADGALVGVVRPLLLGVGTMLAGADDLLATARTPVALVNPAEAAARGLADGDEVLLTSATGATLTLALVTATDVVAGTVVLPGGATLPPVTSLADAEGAIVVTLEAASADAPPVAVGVRA
jgi:NADH-quinone oxidoreductase subunit G